MKILIIEEGFDDGPNVEWTLRKDYTVSTASTVEEGLSCIQHECPDMVFWGPDLPVEKSDEILKLLSLRGTALV